MDKEGLSITALLAAMFFELSTKKEPESPTQPEKRERTLRELIRKRKKPVVLFIDEAHDLKRDTLVRLKRLMEIVRGGEGILSDVLAGHPTLTNEQRRAAKEEIGSRAVTISLDHAHGANRGYIQWPNGCSSNAPDPAWSRSACSRTRRSITWPSASRHSCRSCIT